jgi:NAD(P)-dependent dehydrogenase (short-subunit alcohol dehydrogenase family)
LEIGMLVQGKTIVILGGSNKASMGAAAARLLKENGANIVLAARREAELKDVAAEIGAESFAADITDGAKLEALAAHAVDRFGRLDGAINFAGVSSSAPILDIDEAVLLEAARIHFIGTALFIKAMAKAMTGGGSIATTSTLTALLAPPELAVYSASKKAADQVVRVAANELGVKGIRVNSVAPGFTRSEMTEGYFAVPTVQPAFEKEIPLGRLGTVDDVAGAMLWLMSDLSRSTTGQVIDVTSGQSLRRTPRPDEMGF